MIGLANLSVGGDQLRHHTGRALLFRDLVLPLDQFDDEDRVSVAAVDRARTCTRIRRHRDVDAACAHHNFVRLLRRHVEQTGDTIATYIVASRSRPLLIGESLFFEVRAYLDASTDIERRDHQALVAASIEHRAPDHATTAEIAKAVVIILQCAGVES